MVQSYGGGLFNEQHVVLRSGEGRFFELDAPEGGLPFVKVWETNQVLISWVDGSFETEDPLDSA